MYTILLHVLHGRVGTLPVAAPGGFLGFLETLPAINYFTAERSATRAH